MCKREERSCIKMSYFMSNEQFSALFIYIFLCNCLVEIILSITVKAKKGF